MKTDVVCGRQVTENTPFKTTYGDRPYYFSSKECEMEFVKDPMKYVDKSKAASSLEGSPVADPVSAMENEGNPPPK